MRFSLFVCPFSPTPRVTNSGVAPVTAQVTPRTLELRAKDQLLRLADAARREHLSFFVFLVVRHLFLMASCYY